MSRNIYRDGQTRDGYIAAADRMHDELAFTYRPMLPEDVEFTDEERRKLEPRKSVQFLAAQITKHLVTWSEVDDDGKPMEVSLKNVLRLPHLLLTQAYLIVAGHLASDVDPAKGEAASAIVSEADKIIASVAGGRDLNDVGRDEKNSVRA